MQNKYIFLIDQRFYRNTIIVHTITAEKILKHCTIVRRVIIDTMKMYYIYQHCV